MALSKISVSLLLLSTPLLAGPTADEAKMHSLYLMQQNKIDEALEILSTEAADERLAA